MASKFINNFTGGEFTPLLDGRSDLAKYDSACRNLENFRVMAHGGVRFRTGFAHVDYAPNDDLCRLLPFQFSVDVRYIMALTENIITFYDAATTAPSLFVPTFVASPYLESELFEIQIRQLNDIVYFVHPNHPPYKLKRLTAAPTWEFLPVDWTYPPMRDENVSGTKLSLNAVGSSPRVMTATAATFQAGHVGSYWELRHLVDAVSESIALGNTNSTMATPLSVEAEWQVTTTNYWNGQLFVERSDDGGTTWTVIRTFKSATDRNVTASGILDTPALMRLRFVSNGDPFSGSVWVGSQPTSYAKANAVLETQDAYVRGLVKVTAVTSPTSADVTVIKEPRSTDATDVWSEGAWSDVCGYPRAIAFYEQRIFYGGTKSNPIRFWGSRTGDFDNFEYGVLDTNAVAFEIASSEANSIEWMASMDVLQIGTEGSEVTAASGSREEPLTPSNISVRTQSNYGSQAIDALLVNDTLLFMQRQGRRLREMSYNFERDRYISPDLTQLAEHVTESGVIQTAVARQPDPLVLSVLTDGRLAVMTYDREQNVVAWSTWETQGKVESVTAVYGYPNDEIWLVVNRGTDQAPSRQVERMAVESLDKETMNHLDASVVVPYLGSGNNNTVITGLGHLEGKTVAAVVLGSDLGDFVVSGGQITVPNAIPFGTNGTATIGLRYEGVINPMKLDVVSQLGPTQGKRRRISEIVIRFKDSLGCKFGKSRNNLDPVIFRQSTDLMDESPPLFTGDQILRWQGGSDRSADVFIVQDEPYPCVVLGLAIKFDVFNQ